MVSGSGSKAEFFIDPQQSQINPSEHMQMNGIAERGVTEVKIDIADFRGTILRSYTSSVSGSDSLNF
jgi:hypothetical protein